jgi:parallel beta-helix repeat protein
MYNFIKLLIIMVVAISIPRLSFAVRGGSSPTWTAASCNASDINACITAASAGDTIMIPAGTCTWTCTTNCPSVRVNKPVSLIGAGEGSTKIIDDSSTGYPKNALTVDYSSSSNTFIRISGFTLQHSAGAQDSDASIQVYPGGSGQASVRIDHITATGLQRWLEASASVIGLIDHVTITNCDMIFDGDYTTEWNKTLTLGSNDAWYIEDSTFTYSAWTDGVLDCQYGARVVYRHNTVTIPNGSGFSGYLIGNHGYDSVYRGCMSMEVYNNTITHNSSNYLSGAIQFRGGTGVVFNNTILGSGHWNMYLPITNYRSCSGYVSYPAGYCNGSHAEDGNVDHGWPCQDQIGRGGKQASVPLYEWNNCYGAACGSGGTPVHFETYNGSTGDCSYQDLYHIKPNRDYYNNTQRPEYTPYTYPHPLTGGTPTTYTYTVYTYTVTPSAGANGSINPNTPQTVNYNDTIAFAVTANSGYHINTVTGCGGSLAGSTYTTAAITANCAVTATFAIDTAGSAYYVDNSGSPACSDAPSYGTEAHPWCTISYAIGRMSGGDDLYVKNGTYSGGIVITGPSGTFSKSTAIRAYPGHSPIIRGPGYNSNRVKLSGVNYMEFSGFEVTYLNEGIYVENSNYITVQNCNVYDIGQEGISFKTDSIYGTIRNNTIHDTGKLGKWGEGIYIGTQSGGPLDNSNNMLIQNNTIYNNTDEPIELKPGTHDCTVDGNTIYTSGANMTPDIGAIEVDETNSNVQVWNANPNHIIKNNIIHDVDTGIRAGTGGTYFNNVIYNIGSGYGILVNNNSSDSYTRKIYHNTIDVTSSNAVRLNGGTADVRNNIGPTTTNNMATNNVYYVNQEGANYHLVAGSAPINAGLDLTATVPTDKDGGSRSANGAPDMGAYEYSSSTNRPSPPLGLRTIQ